MKIKEVLGAIGGVVAGAAVALVFGIVGIFVLGGMLYIGIWGYKKLKHKEVKA